MWWPAAAHNSTGSIPRTYLLSMAPASTRYPLAGADDRICLDFQEPVGVDEATDLHNGTHRTDRAEHFTMNARNDGPVIDTREENPGPDHICQRPACLFEGIANDLETTTSLSRRISDARRLAVGSDRRGSRNMNDVADANRAREPYLGFEWTT